MAKKKDPFAFSEEQIHRAVCNYIFTYYPDVKFLSDIAGVNLNEQQRKRVYSLRSNRGFPDIMIFHPNDKYHGLFIEMKKDGEKILRKDGEVFGDRHLQEQSEIISHLNEKGYLAAFCIGYESAVNLIKSYMDNAL